MRESQLIDALHKLLPPASVLHRQSMTYSSLSYNGTPDRYYDGPAGDLWIEYKKLDSMPRSGVVGGVDEKKPGCYRPNQYAWMERRWNNGGNVLGAIFLPNKLVVVQFTPEEWREGTPVSSALSRHGLADTIKSICLGATHGK